LHQTFEEQRDHMIGAMMIDMLDEAGYLREEPEAIAQKLGCKVERVENLLREMKGFDPAGIFARDLTECLALQLAEKNALDGPMNTLLDHLEMLGHRDFKGLAEICGVNETYLMDMVAEIKALNPKPAGEFDHLVVQTAVPDVLMKRMPKNLGGGWRVELNHETLPRVLINQEYYKMVAGSASRKEDKD